MPIIKNCCTSIPTAHHETHELGGSDVVSLPLISPMTAGIAPSTAGAAAGQALVVTAGGGVSWATVGGGNSDSGWIFVGSTGAPSFVSGWGNYGSYASRNLCFRRFGKVVAVQGLITNSGTYNTVFSLPEGFIPSCLLAFPTVKGDGTIVPFYVAENGSVIGVTGSSYYYIAFTFMIN